MVVVVEAMMDGLRMTGFFCVVGLFLYVARILVTYVLRPAASFAKYRGEWAVVTGASSGIGAGFAVQLAKRGVNVAMIARSEAKMKELAASKMGNVQTRVIPFDFDTAAEEDYFGLQRQLEGLTVSILVNNVGVNVEYPKTFLDTTVEEEDRMIRVNIGATLKMTRMLAPAMKERKKGLIYFLSSASGRWLPSSFLSIYGGTKAFMDNFAVALAGELEEFGVIVHTVVPFHVKTAMAKVKKSITAPLPEDFANKCLNHTGTSIRLNPHWAHFIVATVVNLLPLKNQCRIVSNSQKATRARALKKLASSGKSQ
mmetsp:Transcript_11817/g.24095  ORF Transcript_11817/g.24095 Transcript_11817/m.24095 type:complete len:312 (-) Transcript_11817:923-1858(-)